MPNELTPELRFPEFEDEWEEKRLGKLFSNSKTKGNDSIPIYSVSQDKGLVPRESLDRNIQKDAESGDNLKVQPNDLVYNTMRMWQGAVGFAVEECMVSPAYVVLSPQKKVDSQFFLYFFERLRTRYLFTIHSHGLTLDRLRLYYKDFSGIKVKVPTYIEQKKIANFLTAVDEKIKTLTKKKTMLEEYKKGVMQRLFSQEIRFKDEQGQDFPDWEEKKLGEVAVRNITKNKYNELTLVLTNSATQGIVSQTEYFDKEIANQNNINGYYMVEENDFVYNPRVSATAPVGPIKRNRLSRGVMSPLYSVFRFNTGILDFFEQYFETSFWHSHLESAANIGARHDRMNISMEDFYTMPIPYPSLPEQQKIAKFLTALDEKITKATQQIETARAFKKGLLQKMFV